MQTFHAMHHIKRYISSMDFARNQLHGSSWQKNIGLNMDSATKKTILMNAVDSVKIYPPPPPPENYNMTSWKSHPVFCRRYIDSNVCVSIVMLVLGVGK